MTDHKKHADTKSAHDATLEKIAKATHEINRAYCAAIGDNSQPSWEDAPDWQKASAMAGVKAVLDGTCKTPEEQHASWMAQKAADGWVYGATKDPERKKHPCMVPYAELPQQQQVKDHLFRAACAVAAELVGGKS